MLKPLIRRQFFWTVVIFIVVGWCAHNLTRLLFSRERFDMLQHQAIAYQYAIEHSPASKEQTVKELNEINRESGSPLLLELLPDNGSPLMEEHQPPPGPPPLFGGFGKPPPPPPAREIRLSGPEKLKLAVRLGPPPDGGRNPMFMTLIIFGAIALASFLSVFFFFWRFKEKAEIAKQVLSRIQQGDLKARFPISKWDDAAQILRLFNQMADEIERLVDSLRDNEKARTHLLQELAHDLRTPVASLRNLLEGLNDSSQPFNPESRLELTGLALKETEYLAKLVEDMLFLALVIEPKYKSESHEIAVQDLLQNQITIVSNKYPGVEISKIYNTSSGKRDLIIGNPHLLTRLVRNALENASSFAKSSVAIIVSQNEERVEIAIRDNGPGFSTEALENFGKKRASRYLSNTQADLRISVGLGSVIMQAIAAVHGGTVIARNIKNENGDLIGGEVLVSLPKSQSLSDDIGV